MKKIVIFVVLTLLTTLVNGQQFNVGATTGESVGIWGVYSNPALLSSSSKKWDVGLFSINAGVGTDKLELDYSSLSTDNYFEDNIKTMNGDASGIINLEVTGPSFMLKINPKHTIGISSRVRVMGNISTLNTTFLEGITTPEDLNDLPKIISAENQTVALNGWAEIGGSWSGLVYQDATHTLRAGVTLKYLKGMSSSYVNVDNLRADLNVDANQQDADAYLTNGTGLVETVNGGTDFTGDDFKAGDAFSKSSAGFGIDLGLIYEYRGQGSDELLKDNKDYVKPYKYRIGVALQDLGSIEYDLNKEYTNSYSLNIPQGKKMYLNNVGNSLEEIKEFLDKSPYATEKDLGKTIKTSLPTSLNLSVDYHISSKFYAEVLAQFSLVNKDDKVQNPYYYNSITFVPRMDSKYYGVYVPVNYNSLTGMNAGVTLRLGPLMVGSSSAINQLFGSSKQVDIFAGVRFGL